ncbi:hypothetical protein JD844_002590 [Phrynosoma platyrhinos]|uniref:WW domain binding protein VOPP1 n=1 Tax=Phrynosoma platyrhinos TaxID=52577 RepID=A0ABQ7TBP5_PHRPL|nr:hypothetical protein JD844_002590 [Phrynosoma platyrhinos]
MMMMMMMMEEEEKKEKKKKEEGYQYRPVPGIIFCLLSGAQQPGMAYYPEPEGAVMSPMAMTYHVQPKFPQVNPVYPPPPSYCNTPPPPYEQAMKSST